LFAVSGKISLDLLAALIRFRLRDLFDKGQHPAWNKIIIQDEKRKGFYLIKK
jgi:hypothetical protein